MLNFLTHSCQQLNVTSVVWTCLTYEITSERSIKATDSVQNFKKQLKTLLFRKEFN